MIAIIKTTLLQPSATPAQDTGHAHASALKKGDLLSSAVDKTIQSQTMSFNANQQRSEKWVFQEGMDVRYVLSGDQIVEKNPPKYVLDRYAEAQVLQKKERNIIEVA